MAASQLRIASRRSQLAMVQTHWVRDELAKAHPGLEISIEAMATQGDKILDVALAKIGDKGLFTKELEAQMLVDRADIAVHSLKDLPTNLPEGLMLGCVTEREDPADALVVHEKHKDKTLATLPAGAVVGTSSLRRLAQLRHHFPHLTFKDVRGNVIASDGEAGTLVISEQARVDGEIRVSHIVVNGTVNGPVTANDYLNNVFNGDELMGSLQLLGADLSPVATLAFSGIQFTELGDVPQTSSDAASTVVS